MMGVLSRRVLDGSAPGAYNPPVADSQAPNLTAPMSATPMGRRRRRPPSLSEQANRTTRIRPWADTFKALKAGGRWR